MLDPGSRTHDDDRRAVAGPRHAHNALGRELISHCPGTLSKRSSLEDWRFALTEFRNEAFYTAQYRFPCLECTWHKRLPNLIDLLGNCGILQSRSM